MKLFTNLAFATFTIVATLSTSVADAKCLKAATQEIKTVVNRETGKTYKFRQDNALAKRNAREAENTELTPIVDPAGEKKEYQRESISFYTFMGEQGARQQSYSPTIFSFDGEETIYIENPVSNNGVGGWIKGERKGNVLEVKCPQILAQWEEEDWMTGDNVTYTYYVSVLSEQYDEQLEGYTFKLVPEEEQTFRFNINPDGTFTSADPMLMLGVTGFYNEWYSQVPLGTPGGFFDWKGNGDCTMTIKPMDYEPVTPPADLQISSYGLICKYDIMDRTSLLNAGIKDNKFYIQGLFERMPEVWVCGDIKGDKGDKITFPTTYMGLDKTGWNYLFLMGVEYAPGEDDPDTFWPYLHAEVIMDYDAEKGMIKQNKTGMIINSNPSVDDLYYIIELDNIVIKSQDIVTTYIPKAPADLYGWQYAEGQIDGRLGLTLNPMTVDYILLDEANMYYEVLMDGQPLTVDVDGGNTSRIPMDYVGENIQSYGNDRYISFDHEVENLKVRSAYVHEGETYYSDYAELKLELSGVDTIINSEVKNVEYYDIAGRRVATPARGTLVIKKTTTADGAVKYGKIIF